MGTWRPITDHEMKEVVENRSYSSPGLDTHLQRQVSIFWHGNRSPMRIYYDFLLSDQELVDRFIVERMAILPKKNIVTHATDTRGIGVSNAFMGTFDSLIAARITRDSEHIVHGTMGGSRTKRGIGDQLYIFRLLLWMSLYFKIPLVLSSTDIAKMYDNVNLPNLDRLLRHFTKDAPVHNCLLKSL